MNYNTSNFTTDWICNAINSTTTCVGTISVVPANQELIIVLLTIIAICIIFLLIFQIWEKIS